MTKTYSAKETIGELVRRGKIPRRVNADTLYRWLSEGRLPGAEKERHVVSGPVWVIPESAIEKFPNE